MFKNRDTAMMRRVWQTTAPHLSRRSQGKTMDTGLSVNFLSDASRKEGGIDDDLDI